MGFTGNFHGLLGNDWDIGEFDEINGYLGEYWDEFNGCLAGIVLGI